MLISARIWRIQLRDAHNRLVAKFQPHHLFILSPVTKSQRDLPEYLENRYTNDRLITNVQRQQVFILSENYPTHLVKIYNFSNFTLELDINNYFSSTLRNSLRTSYIHSRIARIRNSNNFLRLSIRYKNFSNFILEE